MSDLAEIYKITYNHIAKNQYLDTVFHSSAQQTV
jgi:hypothetical protein